MVFHVAEHEWVFLLNISGLFTPSFTHFINSKIFNDPFVSRFHTLLQWKVVHFSKPWIKNNKHIMIRYDHRIDTYIEFCYLALIEIICKKIEI